MAANGFFIEVLEVERVFQRKNKKMPGAMITYAQCRLEGSTITIPVLDGVSIPEGWSGKATGAVRVDSFDRKWQGSSFNVSAFTPVFIDRFIPIKQVEHASTSMIDSFLNSTPREGGQGVYTPPRMADNPSKK